MFRYPATIEPDGEFFAVDFPDLPYVHSQGNSVEDAKIHAVDALATALYLLFEDGKEAPVPSPLQRGEHMIELRFSFSDMKRHERRGAAQIATKKAKKRILGKEFGRKARP
jgi:predicted RNase H-like HicB family nuclease